MFKGLIFDWFELLIKRSNEEKGKQVTFYEKKILHLERNNIKYNTKKCCKIFLINYWMHGT